MTATMLDPATITDEFAHRPDDTVESHYRHLARYRRVRVGPAVTVVFEDQHTLWFRMHELTRFGRRSDAVRVRSQLQWYRRLMPGDGRLCAAVTIAARGRSTEANRFREALTAGRLVLRSDDGHEVVGRYLPHQQTDPLIGVVRWAEFRFPWVAQAALHDPNVGWELSVDADGVTLAPVRMPEPVLVSLSADIG